MNRHALFRRVLGRGGHVASRHFPAYAVIGAVLFFGLGSASDGACVSSGENDQSMPYCGGYLFPPQCNDLPHFDASFRVDSSIFGDPPSNNYVTWCCSPPEDTDPTRLVLVNTSRTVNKTSLNLSGSQTAEITGPYNLHVHGSGHITVNIETNCYNCSYGAGIGGSGGGWFQCWNTITNTITISISANPIPGVRDAFAEGGFTHWRYTDHPGYHIGVGTNGWFSIPINESRTETFTLTPGLYEFGFGFSGDSAYGEEHGVSRHHEFNVTYDVTLHMGAPFGCETWTVDPSVLDYGTNIVGQTRTQSLQVVNRSISQTWNGTAEVRPFPEPVQFVLQGTNLLSLGPGQTGLVQVCFAPTQAGWFTNQVVFQGNFSDAGAVTGLVTGAARQMAVQPRSWDFGTIAIGATTTATFTITNRGGLPVQGTAISSGPPFNVSEGSPFTLDAFEEKSVLVTFTPQTWGTFTGTVVFASDGGTYTNDVIGKAARNPFHANFTATPTNGNAGVVVQFNDTSTGPIDNRLWDYGDGHTLFTTNTAVSNSYAVPGQYSVCLTVFSQSAQDMLCRTNYITVLPCGGGYIIAPSSATCDSAGCSGEITVTADPGCPWNANSQADWLLLGPGGSGPGAVQYTVGSNSACLSRTGTAVIAGHVFSLVQAPGPGSFAISSDEVTCGGNGCNGIVTVSTEPGCAWETSSQAPWIGIGAGGIGPGTVSYAVDENPECAPRTGNATIAGWSLTVNQDPGSGEVALTPPTATCTASGGSGSLHVAAGAGCEWDVYTLAQWVTITSGNKGEGSSDVNYSVAANESNCISRTGTIWVADQSFTLVQDAGAGSYSLNPSTRLSTAAGGHGAVIIAAGTGCQWTASSDSAWLHASGSGFGNGSASYLVDANMGGTRTGYVSIATETLTIIQNAGPPERTGYVVFPILAGDPNVQAHGAAGNGTNFLIAIRGGEGYSGLIVVQRVSPHGDLIGQPISLGRSGGTPNIGFDGTNCLVVWPDEGNGYPNDQIYGQFVSLFGDLIGPPFPISTSAGIKDLNSTRPLVFDGTWYWVAWQYASDEEAASDIYGRWVDPVSGPQGVEIGICTNTGEQTTPVVAASRTNILAAWWNRTAPSPEPWEVAGRFLTRLGDMADIPTISQTNSLDMNPFDAVFNGTNYLVVWSRNLTSNPTNHLYGRFLSPAGVFPGPEFPIVTGTANQVFPMAAFDGANHLVGWSDGNGNIRFLYLTTAGQAMGQEFNVFEPGQGNYPPLYGSVVSTGRRFLSVATMGPGFDDSTDVFGAFIPNSIEPSWLMISNQATRLELTGVPGQDYLFQWATDLLLSNAWSDWFTTNAGNGALNLIGTNPLGQVYYRAIQGSEP